MKKIKKYIKKINTKFENKIEIYKKKFKILEKKFNKLNISSQIAISILSIMFVEFIIVTPVLIYEKIEEVQISKTFNYKVLISEKDFSLPLNDFLKNNSNYIEEISLLRKKDNNFFDMFIKMKSNYISEDLKVFKEDFLIKATLPVFEKVLNSKPNIYLFMFKDINYFSFTEHYEKILIDKKINYYWFKDKKKNPYRISSFIIDNSLRILLIILFIYLFEKQGLLGNKEKYSIVLPSEVDMDFNQLIGMEDIKKEIFILADLIKYRDKYKDFGIEKTFNYLFSGPPGTGKTKIASGLAKLLDIPMIVGTGNVETGFINGGVSVIQELFKTATNEALKNEHKMALIFLDEAQNLMVKRGQSRDKWADDSANELLAQLDGIHTNEEVSIIFIAASNFDDKNHEFDEAMMRRFKKKLYFRLPNLEERKEILKYYLSKVNKKYLSKNIDVSYIADITSNLSPALLESIVQEASLLSITKDKNLNHYLEKNNNIENFEDNIIKIDTILLEKAFEIISVGRTDRETTKNQENEREIISKHELGHFICELQTVLNKKYSKKYFEKDLVFLNEKNYLENIKYLKENLNVLKISVESISQINALGYVLNKQSEISLKSKRTLENEIISLYGGLGAETVFSKDKDEITTGSSNDIDKISNILNIMVNKLGMYSKSKINLNLIDNVDNKKENTDLIISKSEELFSISLSYIKEYIELIEYLNKILLKEYVLNLEQILQHIQNFYMEKEKIE